MQAAARTCARQGMPPSIATTRRVPIRICRGLCDGKRFVLRHFSQGSGDKTHDTKANIVVPIRRFVVVPIGRTRVLRVIVPRTAADHAIAARYITAPLSTYSFSETIRPCQGNPSKDTPRPLGSFFFRYAVIIKQSAYFSHSATHPPLRFLHEIYAIRFHEKTKKRQTVNRLAEHRLFKRQ